MWSKKMVNIPFSVSKYALHERKTAKYEIIWAKAYNNDVVLNVVYVQILKLVRAQFDFTFEAEENDNEIKSGLV